MLTKEGINAVFQDANKLKSVDQLYEGSMDVRNPTKITVYPKNVYREFFLFVLPSELPAPCETDVDILVSFMYSNPAGDQYKHTKQFYNLHIAPQNGLFITFRGAGNEIVLDFTFRNITQPGFIYIYVVGVM